MEKVVYLDNNATTMVAPKVFDAMKPYFCELYGNPSSMHEFGGQVAHAVADARESEKDLTAAENFNRQNLSELANPVCSRSKDCFYYLIFIR